MTIAKVGQVPAEVLRQDTTSRIVKVGQVAGEVPRQNTLVNARMGQLVVEVLRNGVPYEQPGIWVST